MQSFYGGPAGQSFYIKEIFSSYEDAKIDAALKWSSSIAVGEFIMVSYGTPGTAEYEANKAKDNQENESNNNFNSTLWQKMYDGQNMSYRYISQLSGATPKIKIGETKVLASIENPKVEINKSDTDSPEIIFSLPKAVKFYYGNLLGENDKATIYKVEDITLKDCDIGDYYINEKTGYIYLIIEKVNDTTCHFRYQATIQQPLPTVAATNINPYIQDENGYKAASPKIDKNLTEDGWQLDFKLPSIPTFNAISTFIGSTEEGSISTSITNQDMITFNFEIPSGSKLFNGINSPEMSSLTDVRIGDYYINTATGEIFCYEVNNWISKGSLRGPTGKPLNIIGEIYIYSDIFNKDQIGLDLEDKYDSTIINDSSNLFPVRCQDIDYWFYKVKNNWSFLQVTGGLGNLLSNEEIKDEDGSKNSRTYTAEYINKLQNNNSANLAEINNSLASINKNLIEINEKLESTWGSYQGDE